ncbi:gluconate 2-dehydrogenase subunit 3 family protein [Szabonella alba]|uniref:Gluconate 2-dehydrogenase subunit 3 family protein n=1 Tax=Szabonella alba TaxID=2804194 RepID=A0A8K0VD56_9RHOB|nr:gluconate 2-dehydrogenase subunit 3 family protein [Szabonella alba]MBL4918906.1 gluconate 2-dehydrogenase subunit 3 family protein [Szabonella alba]
MTFPPEAPLFPPASRARRQFLQVSAASLAMVGLSAPFPAMAQADLPPLEDYAPEFFTPGEWAFVLAAVARLIPSEGAGPGAIEARVPVFIDRQLDGNFGQASDWYMAGPHQADAAPEFGWQTPLSPAEVYRAAIPVFDDWCRDTLGAPFAGLETEAQDEALTRLEAEEVPLAPEIRDFFKILLANTKEGYFSDPIHGGNHGMAAWVHIGFPGARAHYLDWVGQHNVRYPLGPVSISGERA